MVHSTIPGIVIDDYYASAYQVRFKTIVNSEQKKIWKQGIIASLAVLLRSFFGELQKKPARKPAIHSSLITGYNAKFESQTSKFLSPVYG